MRETSFAHTTKMTTEARAARSPAASDAAAETGRGGGRKPQQEPRRQRKALAGRYYKFLSGHAATGAYQCKRMGNIPSDGCWWCSRDERQTRYHLFTR